MFPGRLTCVLSLQKVLLSHQDQEHTQYDKQQQASLASVIHSLDEMEN